MFTMLHLKCFVLFGTGTRLGNEVHWGGERHPDFVPFHSTGAGDLGFCRGVAVWLEERRPDAALVSDVGALGCPCPFPLFFYS
jgi:hypothetical protein